MNAGDRKRAKLYLLQASRSIDTINHCVGKSYAEAFAHPDAKSALIIDLKFQLIREKIKDLENALDAAFDMLEEL